MASNLSSLKKGIDNLSGSEDGKIHTSQIDDIENEAVKPAMTTTRTIEAPDFIRKMSPEDRMSAESNLKRKIDIRLMPMIILMYIMNYLDRNNIAAAKLAGLPEDLKLVKTQFQTSVSILFVGYLLMQVPSNLFLNKIGKPGIYLPACMVVWGIISTATAACQDFGELIACRFMLGFIEAAYFPGCLYYLSCWYTRKELGFRTALFYSGALISGAFSGLIAAGVKAHMDGLHGLRAWRWLFIIEGSITIGIAIASFFILPNFPRTTKWLTEEERALAIWRLQEDIGADDWVDSEHQSFWIGTKLAFSDVKTYVLMFLLFGIVGKLKEVHNPHSWFRKLYWSLMMNANSLVIASGTVTNFFPTVVATLKYNNVDTLLLTAPPYVLAVITTFINSWHADRTGERFFHITIPLCFAIFAFILAAATTSTAPRYVAMMLMVPGVYSGYVVALAWISNTLPRPPAKRAAALAFINAISNCSSIYASYMYGAGAAPRYKVAMSVNCAMAAMAIISATTLRLMLVRLNRRLDQGISVPGAINSGGFRFRL